jgi:hypothetical protein
MTILDKALLMISTPKNHIDTMKCDMDFGEGREGGGVEGSIQYLFKGY